MRAAEAVRGAEAKVAANSALRSMRPHSLA